jgi:hypothetical protein
LPRVSRIGTKKEFYEIRRGRACSFKPHLLEVSRILS